MSPITLLAILGLSGLIAGGWAARYWRRSRLQESWSTHLRRWHRIAIASGLVLAGASIVLSSTLWLGYPTPDIDGGTGRVVGIPFLEAYFDSQGNDYLGPLTLVSMGANALFWFLVPYTGLAAMSYLAGSARLHPPAA